MSGLFAMTYLFISSEPELIDQYFDSSFAINH